MNLDVGSVLYDSLENKIIVINFLGNESFKAEVHEYVKITYSGRDIGGKSSEMKEKVSYTVFKISTIGCTLFYNVKDKLKGKELSNLEEYLWNKESIIAFYKEQEDIEYKKILQEAPTDVILTEKNRKKLIKGYMDQELSEKEEEPFYNKYAGKYFARMDFDIEFFKRNREDLYKNHYYDKIYVGKQGSIYDNGKYVIVDWRSPIGGFFGDNKNRGYNIGENLNPHFAYNYELLLKRRFISDGAFKNVWVADSSFYSDGDMDPFLLDVLTRLRRSGNDKAVDIIETIQKEQNEIVRLNNKDSFYVQGCAGSGKTMVLLHRLSYLSYNKLIDPSKVKIITPNENIIMQLKDLSAQLEISDIDQMTIEQYYIYLIKEYSESLYNTLTSKKESLINGTKKHVIKSENSIDRDFLEHVYSDDFKNCIDDAYKRYFDNLFNRACQFVNTENKYDLDSIHQLSKDIYSFIKKENENLTKIEKINVELELVKQREENIISNINKLKIENKKTFEDLKLIDKYAEDIRIIDEVLLTQRQKDNLKVELEKEKSLLCEIENLEKELKIEKKSFSKEIKIKDFEELKNNLFLFKENDSDIKNKIKKNIEKSSILKNKFEEKENEYENILNQFNNTSKLNVFLRLKLKSQITMLKNEKDKNSHLITENSNENKFLLDLLNKNKQEYENYLYNANNFIKDLKNKKDEEILDIEKEIMILQENINKQLNKNKYGNKDLNDVKKELKTVVSVILEDSKEKKEALNGFEKELSKIYEEIGFFEKELKSNGFLFKDEKAEFIKLCNLLLVKKDKQYENKLKLTGVSVLGDILSEELSNLYKKYNIQENSDLYKFKLYLNLYILIKLRGEKSIDNFICIDEAQDITKNEYDLIKKSNNKAIFNLYGDTNQLLYKGRGIENWASLTDINFKLKGFKLNRNYRNISNITKYCNEKLIGLEMIEMGVSGEPVEEININSLYKYLNEKFVLIVKNRDCLNLLDLNGSEYNFIENKEDIFKDNILNILTVEMSKGMEFSNVIVFDKDMIRREKYVAYTRALNKLIVVK